MKTVIKIKNISTEKPENKLFPYRIFQRQFIKRNDQQKFLQETEKFTKLTNQNFRLIPNKLVSTIISHQDINPQCKYVNLIFKPVVGLFN